MAIVDPDAYVPSAADEENAEIVGERVSTGILRIELQAAYELPPTSDTAPGPMQILGFPLERFAVGVNTTVYVEPEPEAVPNVPPKEPVGHR